MMRGEKKKSGNDNKEYLRLEHFPILFSFNFKNYMKYLKNIIAH